MLEEGKTIAILKFSSQEPPIKTLSKNNNKKLRRKK